MGRGKAGTLVTARSQAKLLFLTAVCVLLWSLVGCDEEQKEMVRLRALNNHAKHVALNMECTGCHSGARERVYATLPSIKKCALCHKLDRDYPPTPTELAKHIETGEEIPWIRVNRIPGHVYFSHVAHVKYGEISCGKCHGDMKDSVHPAERPLVQPPNMSACIDCHQRRQVSTDCLTCHK